MRSLLKTGSLADPFGACHRAQAPRVGCTIRRVTRSADTRLGVLLVVLVLGLNVLAVSSRLGFLHKPNQVKEYDHRRYIEMA